VTGTILKETGA